MIKLVALILGVFAATFLIVSCFFFPQALGILPTIPTAIPQIAPLIDTVTTNPTMLLGAVGGTATTVFAAANYLHKRGINKERLESAIRETENHDQLLDTQSQLRGALGKVETLASENETLKTAQTTVAEVTSQLTASKAEVQAKITEVNTLQKIIHDDKVDVDIAKKIIELQKKH